MKTVNVHTLATGMDSLLKVNEGYSDCIEIIDSETVDLDLLESALKAQAKHGALGEAMRYLFIEDEEKRSVLLMKEAREIPDWLEAYKAVYWFVCGWTDCDFNSKR